MRVALPQGTMVLERRGGRACFAEVKEESYSPLAACRTGDMEQNRPARPGATALNSASKARNEPESEAEAQACSGACSGTLTNSVATAAQISSAPASITTLRASPPSSGL